MFNSKNYCDWRQYCHGLHKSSFFSNNDYFCLFYWTWVKCGSTKKCVLLSFQSSLCLSVFLNFCMWQEIYNLQKSSPILAHKRIKLGLSRLFEKFCYLNFLEMSSNESSCNFYFPVANPSHTWENYYVCISPKTFFPNQTVRFFKLQYLKKQSIKLIFSCDISNG